ncbi:hypothetical protein LIER_35084 [Lithospermum erythrorhizon]|uniref:Gag-protease polyprotein n=1 Tax=Lithospermum erythrorhizon TaxID=34254 RepID=A0AAV3NKB4_LITER
MKSVKQGNANMEQKDKPKGIQCIECEGFGHIQAECPNYVKRQSKNYYTTLTDDDSEDEEEKVSNFVAFTAQSEPPIDDSLPDKSKDEEAMTEEELLEDYKLLYSKWTELTMIYTKAKTEKGRLKKEIEKLLKIVEDRDEEIKGLNVQLTNILEEILVIGKNVGDTTGIGYKKGKTSNQKGEAKFVAARGNQQSSTGVTTQRIKMRPD